VPKQICRNFSTGATAKVKGTWVESIGPGQDREILADEFIVLHQNQIHSINGDFSHLRSRAHLRFKHPAVATVLKLRSDMNFYTHKFFKVILINIKSLYWFLG
jgi:aspartyl/asparaginyl-tRNA synthetase